MKTLAVKKKTQTQYCHHHEWIFFFVERLGRRGSRKGNPSYQAIGFFEGEREKCILTGDEKFMLYEFQIHRSGGNEQ